MVLIDSSGIHNHLQTHQNFQRRHLPAKYIKRKPSRYNSMYSEIHRDHSSYLHLNSLWSIWYGVLFTLFQGYLAVHGAYRFLGCSLILWKIEPVAELNLQIILSGLVFVLLPFFFTSAVFKVGNLANDGIKLGFAAKEKRCSMAPNDGLEEESRSSTFRTLWTHGGPTSAFIHIVIAMCLLLPRLLLEGRIIENGLLPREAIWQTELDFITLNHRNLVVLSIKASPYKNTTMFESQEDEDYLNDTVFTVYPNNGNNANNKFLNNTINLHSKVAKATFNQNINGIFNTNYMLKEISTIPPLPTFIYEEVDVTSNDDSFTSNFMTTTTQTDYGNDVTFANTHLEVETAYDSNFLTINSTQQPFKSIPNFNQLTSLSSKNSKNFSYHKHHHNDRRQDYKSVNIKYNRRQHRQKKTSSYLAQRKNRNQMAMESSKRIKELPHSSNVKSKQSINLHETDEKNIRHSNGGSSGIKINEHWSSSFDESDFGKAKDIYTKSLTTISSSKNDSDSDVVKPEKLSETTTPPSINFKIIEIQTKPKKIKKSRDIFLNKGNHMEIKPEYLVESLSFNVSDETEVHHFDSSIDSAIQPNNLEGNIVRLDGFAGMLQMLFGVERPIEVNMFSHPPSAEFINLLFALMVWCVRYPAVFWNTAKSFAIIFSVQMISSATDIIFSFVGISNLYKLHIFSEEQPIQNPGLILNASVTIGLFLLSVILILSSSMVMYLYGHGRLSAKMRDRSIISLKSKESWTYFAHCASLCFILALSVVKVPLLNDLSSTYRYTLHCPTFMAAFISILNILLWILIWLALTIKRKWNFKLPPLHAYAVIGKAPSQPLLMHNRGTFTNDIAEQNNSTTTGASNSPASDNIEYKSNCENTGNIISNTSSSDILNDSTPDDIYWPKIIPSSPKLKVTFNEVTSTSNGDHHHRLFDERKQNDGKRNSPRGTSLCFTSIAGEIDDGEYATLRSGTPTTTGKILDSGSEDNGNVFFYKPNKPISRDKVLHRSECDVLPQPPPDMLSSMTITNHTTTVTINSGNNFENCMEDNANKLIVDEKNLSEEGKILECARDDNVTYASTFDLEPPLPQPPVVKNNTENLSEISKGNQQQISVTNQFSSSTSNHLLSPLVSVKFALKSNDISTSSTTHCFRRADSGVSPEALTPRSDITSCTESTISPPERALSESSSGVHSAEEREIEVVIRHRATCKPIAKLPPPAIQEEPYERSTNMRMFSFAGGKNLSSATLPLQRSQIDEKFDFSQHCNTMPLLFNSHNNYQQQTSSTIYATSSHCMYQSQNTTDTVSSFKSPLYANSGFMSIHKASKLQTEVKTTRPPITPPPQDKHTTLANGARYSNPNILRRHPSIKCGNKLRSHQIFSKKAYESALLNSTIHEDRDSANYSMISDQESFYATANSLY